MRYRRFSVFALSLALTFAFCLPATAAAREDRWLDRDLSFINRVVKQIKKTFRIRSNADTLTLPTP